MNNLKIILIALVAAALLAACGSQMTQAEQVSHGQEVYQAECARCHDGGVGPDLNANILGQRGDAQSLYNYVHTTMPQDKPGQLEDQEYWDVLAYIIDQEGLLPADTVLSDSNAAEVNLAQ